MRKIIICLLSIMLCLGMICINTDIKAYNNNCYFLDDIESDSIDINVTLENSVSIYDYDSSNTYFYKINNDNISLVKENNGYIIKGEKIGNSVINIYENNQLYKQINVHIVDPKITQKSYTVYTTEDYFWDTSVRVNITGINEYSQFEYDDDYDYDYYVDRTNLSKGYLDVYVYNEGKTDVKFYIDNQQFNITITVIKIGLKLSGTINTQLGSIVSYVGKSDDTIKVTSSIITSWKSTNTKIATISSTTKSSVKVKAKGIGRCYIRGYINDKDYIQCLVEVTYKGAYQAVSNGFKDYLKGDYNNSSKPIKYSQSKRMSKGYRDCGSFVSRCYYDTTLSRKIYKIGSIKGNTASTAADQAKWLNANGKKVADTYVDESKLLPGDTIYRGGYNNGRWRGIYHAILYVGNGMVLTTGSSGDTNATLKLKNYTYAQSNIVFIGRPLKTVSTTSISLNKTKITIKKNKKYTLKATIKPSNSTQKVTWSTSNKKIATVSSSGVVIAKKKGTVYITAKSGSKTKKCKVIVK